MIRLSGDRAGVHHCFGCHFGGGPVALVAAVKGITRKEAWQWLRSFCGLGIVAGARASWERKIPETERPALRYPKGTIALWRSPPPEVRPAIDYLLGRGLSEQDLERYAIGAVPPEIKEYGGRVIIPVVVDGRMVDFVARLYVERRLASKALSGRKDRGARKEYALWGYDDLDPELDTVHVCEGVWGGIALRNAGIPNVTAACGSDWTPERTELLAPWERIVLVPDGDPAGSKLVERASSLRFDHELLVADVPPKKQPDHLEPEERRSIIVRAKAAAFHDFPEVAFRPWTGKG